MRRRRQSTERRLHNLYSLGVGGHVNPEDGRDGDPIVGGLLREWREEVVCDVPAVARLIAMINDDGSPVSQVHLGLVFEIEVTGGRVSVREVEKLEGEALSLEDMRHHYLSMESWSQLVFDRLTNNEATSTLGDAPLTVAIPATVPAGTPRA